MNLSKMHVNVRGDLQIKSSGQIIDQVSNAVHGRNMSLAIARGFSRAPNSFIHSMRFGNGGTIPTAGTEVTFKSPNVIDSNAGLYNQTYQETFEPGNTNGNFLIYQEDADLFPVVICQVTLSSNQPLNQPPSGALLENNKSNQFAFDEIGLFTQDNKMLSHVIFNPRLKVEGKELVFTYTLTIFATDEVET